jgi:predicted Ser/Thr protein kinase
MGPEATPPPHDAATEAAGAAAPGASRPAAANIDIADAAEVARRLPQFEIMELLGRGGMGVVYKARQIQLDRIVALKILPPEDAASPGFIERFRREARSLGKLSHPNIVNVHDFGDTNGLYYFVMEFVDGVNLREMIRAHRLTAAEALAVVPKICDALQFAHEEGIVHRDIKPENVLIDKKGRVKIADFGLAKLLGREEIDPRLTVSGATLGTPRYMAPEQVEKPGSVDHRADIYSLGVVFYEMLTGELPMGRFAPPSQKVRIDVRLDEIVLHALERDVDLRYQHASEVRDDVERVTSNPAAAQGTSGAPLTPPTPASRSSPPPAPAADLNDSAFLAALLATLGGAWFVLYLSRIADPVIWIVGYLFFPPATAVLVAWLIATIRRAPGPRFSRFAEHWPLLLGAHVLLLLATVFGARLSGTAFYDVRPPNGGIPTVFDHSEWAIDLWIGPFAVGVAVVALALVLLMGFSRRWEAWRATFVLITGAITLLAIVLFKLAPPALEFTPANREWIILTREPGNGWALSFIPACLLIACGIAMLKHTRTPPVEPRLSRVALWGAIGPPLFGISTISIVAIELTHAKRHETEVLGLGLAFSGAAATIAVTVLGAVAIWQIKRSGGKLYGLRLAIVEAILFPLILLSDLVGLAVFWGIFGLIMLIAPHYVPYVEQGIENAALMVPLVLLAIFAGLSAGFFTGRGIWRAIVRRPAAPSVPNTRG